MDIRKIKIIIILVVVIGSIFVLSYFCFLKIEKPRLETEITQRVEASYSFVDGIVVATRKIMPGEIIDDTMIGSSKFLGESMVNSEYLVKSSSDVVGKVAKTTIYPNEPILSNRIDDNLYLSGDKVNAKNVRKMTFDVPATGFVDEGVGEGSLVDLMLDNGDGTSKLVLEKIYIYKITDIDGNPKPKVANEGENLTDGQRLANLETTDRRVTIIATEEQRTKIEENEKNGKFFFVLHILEDEENTKNTTKETKKSSLTNEDKQSEE